MRESSIISMQRLRPYARSSALFASGVIAALVALVLFNILVPGPPQLTSREVRFVSIALRQEDVPLGNLIHRKRDALWRGPFRNDRATRGRVSQFLSRLNKKLAHANPPFPLLFSLRRGHASILRIVGDQERDSSVTAR